MENGTTVIDRETLYEQVWREPLTRLAERYGLSDVGFRKACVRMNIPLPARGYWAKKAAGKKVRPRPPLPEGAYQHHLLVRHALLEKRSEFEVRFDEAMQRQSMPDALDLSLLPASVDECRRPVRALATKLGNRPKGGGVWREADFGNALRVAVSESSVERALRALEFGLIALEAAGYKLVQRRAKGEKALLEGHGQTLRLSVEERGKNVPREPTEQEREFDRLYPNSRNGEYYERGPTGALSLKVYEDGCYHKPVEMRDGVREPFEGKIARLPAKLAERRVREQVQAEIREEQNRRWEEESRRRGELRARRDEALQQLQEAERDAARWRRARELREYAMAYERAFPDETAEVAWLKRAADWLDPLREVSWPEIDDAHGC